MRDQYQWTAPSPLWAEAADPDAGPDVRAAMKRPALLRFATDTFMEEFLATLEADPTRLGGYLARPETWRSPSASPEPAEEVPRFLRGLSRLRLKGAGLPDHALDANREERAAYVLRRLHQRTNGDAQGLEEYAFVKTAQGGAWQRVTNPAETILPNEERLPLFPVNFHEPDGRRRRLYAGVIPVGKRESYMGAGEAASTGKGAGAPAGQTPKTARKIHFRTQVAEPWKALFVTADAALRLKNESPEPKDDEQPPDTSVLIKNSREQLQTMSWYVLLDLSNYLARYLPNVWRAVEDETKEGELANDAERNLFDALKQTVASDDLKNALTADAADAANRSADYTLASVPTTLLDALRALDDPEKKWGEKLEGVAVSYDRRTPDESWPTFLFPLADPL